MVPNPTFIYHFKHIIHLSLILADGGLRPLSRTVGNIQRNSGDPIGAQRISQAEIEWITCQADIDWRSRTRPQVGVDRPVPQYGLES